MAEPLRAGLPCGLGCNGYPTSARAQVWHMLRPCLHGNGPAPALMLASAAADWSARKAAQTPLRRHLVAGPRGHTRVRTGTARAPTWRDSTQSNWMGLEESRAGPGHGVHCRGLLQRCCARSLRSRQGQKLRTSFLSSYTKIYITSKETGSNSRSNAFNEMALSAKVREVFVDFTFHHFH